MTEETKYKYPSLLEILEELHLTAMTFDKDMLCFDDSVEKAYHKIEKRFELKEKKVFDIFYSERNKTWSIVFGDNILPEEFHFNCKNEEEAKRLYNLINMK